MLQRLRKRLTYANVMASVAVFIALGGTSYAVTSLPRNSVGANQIRTGSVHSSELRNGTIRLADMSRSARSSLRGQIGPQGPAGAQGAPGAPAVSYKAAVAGSGRLLRGNAASSNPGASPGQYVIGFGTSVSGCVYTASVGTTDGTSVGAGRAVVNDQGGNVGVQTYDAAGNPADLPFHLIVAC